MEPNCLAIIRTLIMIGVMVAGMVASVCGSGGADLVCNPIGKELRFAGRELYGHINGGAELFLEFGFQDLTVQRYRVGEHFLDLEDYRMDSAAAAMGIYLSKCGKKSPVAGVFAANSGNRYQLLVVKGVHYFQINNFAGEAEALPAMVELAQGTIKMVAEGEPLKIWEFLPEEHQVADSRRLIRGPFGLEPIFTLGEGDILQLKGEVFGAVANYVDNQERTYTVIVIPYPDPELACTAFENLLVNLDPYLEILSRGEGSILFRDFQEKYGTVVLQGPLMVIKVHLVDSPGLPQGY
jgi:hypothetical protein